MGKNFMEAGTEIGDLVQQRNDILRKIANNVAAAILDRMKSGKTGSLRRDVDNLLNDLSDKEKYEVMVQVAVIMAKSGSSNKQSDKSERHSDPLFNRFK